MRNEESLTGEGDWRRDRSFVEVIGDQLNEFVRKEGEVIDLEKEEKSATT